MALVALSMIVSPVNFGGYFGKDLITPFPVKSVEGILNYSLSWVLYPQLVLFYKLSFRLGIFLMVGHLPNVPSLSPGTKHAHNPLYPFCCFEAEPLCSCGSC